MNRITRRRFLVGLGTAATAAAANGFIVEPNRVVVTRHSLSSNASKPGPTLRVLQITDLHLNRVSRHERHIASAANRLEPDVIFITGDSIDERTNLPLLGEFLALLDSRSTKFATLGNWEHWSRVDLDELSTVYGTAGCRLLINETARFEYSGASLLVTGMDDWTAGMPNLPAALRNVTPSPNHIVLAHSPIFRDVMHEVPTQTTSSSAVPSVLAMSDYNMVGVLSGHTHGGQIALLGWAPVRPAGSGPYVAGWYRSAGKVPLYVSRGLGTSVAPIRFGASPELALFEWQLAAA